MLRSIHDARHGAISALCPAIFYHGSSQRPSNNYENRGANNSPIHC
jgi:hypothetical protein